MSVDVESLKRVLESIKGEARGMRLGKLKSRLNPEPAPGPEGTPMEEASETPEMEAGEGTPLGEGMPAAPADEEAMKLEIQKLLARV
jgi:hypothetical protein